MAAWALYLLVITICCGLSTQMTTYGHDNLQLSFISVKSDNRFSDAFGCDSDQVIKQRYPKKCDLIWRACLLPKCSFTTFLNCTKTRKDTTINLEWRGENTMLIQLWHFDSMAYAHGLSNKAFQMRTEFISKVIPSPTWTTSHLHSKEYHFYLNSRLSCSSCHQMSPKLGELSKRFFFPFNNFQTTFANFVNKMSGFSYRLSNIINLLDIMKRILSNIF